MKLRRMISGMMALLLAASLPLAAFAEEYDLSVGSVTVNASESGQTVSQENGVQNHLETTPTVITQTITEAKPSTDNTVTIEVAAGAEANVTIQDVNIVNSDPTDNPQDHSGQAAVTIDVADNASANVTLDGVNIDVGGTGGYISSNKPGEAAVQITGNGDVTLELDGKNTLQSGHWRAGVEKNTTAATDTNPGSGNGELTITDETGASGSLEATGGKSGSGIGGGSWSSGSNITITGSAEVTATGGWGGSGIGGGSADGNSGSNITIQGNAKVTATGGKYGSGIGGGSLGIGSNITIEGSAEVTATGGSGASGIGGGREGDGSNITITGSAEVVAIGGVTGSGIGGGENGSGSGITIDGNANVTATGGSRGSGIGGGENGSGSGITIDGNANVTATGGSEASGIGGGMDGDGSNITITGSAEVTATGGLNGAGIGGGYLSTGSENITVSQDAQVKAQGGKADEIIGNYYGAGAAIGDGGKYSDSSPDNIAGDEVEPNTNALNEGWIATYTPGTTDLGTAVPNSLTYRDAGGTVQTATENIEIKDAQSAACTEDGHKAGFSVDGALVAVTIPATGHSFTNYIPDNNATYEADGTKTAKCDHCDATHTIPDPGSKLVREAPLYRVIGQDGKALACKEARTSGVLTITVDADFATLTGSFSGLKTLKAQGVDTIVFETNGATSTFAIADLLAQGGDTYALTHDGKTVTFTLGNGTDIGKIL